MNALLDITRASEIIDSFNETRILIIGDLIMDHFIWGKVSRISPEAPVPVVDVRSESIMLGGSANVVNNIHSLGGSSVMAGIIGEDFDGRRLLSIFEEKGISTDGIIVDKSRPTTIKTRVIAHNQQVVRFDRESRARIDADTLATVIDFIEEAIEETDLVLISDYAKGLISPELVGHITALAKKHGKPVAVDPKVEHFDFYQDVTIVTPNNLEASLASAIEIDNEESLHEAGENLLDRIKCEAVLITRGEHGMSLFAGDIETHIPTVAKEVYDVSGAGDTVIGVIGLALASGATFVEASVIANFAAGLVVGKLGTATVTVDELRQAVSEGLK